MTRSIATLLPLYRAAVLATARDYHATRRHHEYRTEATCNTMLRRDKERIQASYRLFEYFGIDKDDYRPETIERTARILNHVNRSANVDWQVVYN